MKHDKKKMKSARCEMLKALSDDMSEEIAEMSERSEKMPKKDKMMKVSVASDSPQGMKEGLDKAKEIMEKKLGKKAKKSMA